MEIQRLSTVTAASTTLAGYHTGGHMPHHEHSVMDKIVIKNAGTRYIVTGSGIFTFGNDGEGINVCLGL